MRNVIQYSVYTWLFSILNRVPLGHHIRVFSQLHMLMRKDVAKNRRSGNLKDNGVLLGGKSQQKNAMYPLRHSPCELPCVSHLILGKKRLGARSSSAFNLPLPRFITNYGDQGKTWILGFIADVKIQP